MNKPHIQNKILVSACLLGQPVRYDAKSKTLNDALLDQLIQKNRVVAFCPEISGGLPTPREPAEIQLDANGSRRVKTATGADLTDAFVAGAKQALSICQQQHIRVAILTELSPSCGSSEIYDGDFNRSRITGAGITTTLLREHGIEVFSQYQIDEAISWLDDPIKPSALKRDQVVDFIFDLFARRGAEEYMGEPVSMAQHMEQSAACAAADGADDEVIIAALLHDIGHFIGDFPIDALENGIDNLHEDAGAGFLQAYFPASVTEPIRLHVAAKKYLCAVDRSYLSYLSSASVDSLNVQGGPMRAGQITEFESNPYHQAAVQLRRYDDDGKVAGLDIKPVTSYRGKLESLLI